MTIPLLIAVAALVCVYAVWGLTLFFMQSKLLYRPAREVARTPTDVGLGFEEVAFQSGDGVMLSGWYVPAEATEARFTILFCHGNGGNVMHRLDHLALFHQLGLSSFIFDYRGFGRSTGRPTEAGTYLDAQAAYDWLIRVKHVPPNRVILFGHSLGGSVAAYLARRVQVRALVIEGAFTSFCDIGAKVHPYFPVRLFARFRYDTEAYIREVRCPVLVLHSKEDELVPFEFGIRLFESANEPKQFIELVGGHNDSVLTLGSMYADAWAQWLACLRDRERIKAVHKAS